MIVAGLCLLVALALSFTAGRWHERRRWQLSRRYVLPPRHRIH